MAKLEILNPQASSVIEAVKPAPRLAELTGKHIGLWWNMKAGGDVALDTTAQILAQHFSGTQFTHYVGSVGAMLRHATAEDATKISQECDAVVGTTSD
jgi:hypothetical protein